MTSLFEAQWAPGAVRADQERARNEAAELAYVNAQKAALPQPSGKSTPSEVFENQLINSGVPQAIQRGLDMRERRMAEKRQMDQRIITGPDGRQHYAGGGTALPDDVYNQGVAAADARQIALNRAMRPPKDRRVFTDAAGRQRYQNGEPVFSDDVNQSATAEAMAPALAEAQEQQKLEMQGIANARDDFNIMYDTVIGSLAETKGLISEKSTGPYPVDAADTWRGNDDTRALRAKLREIKSRLTLDKMREMKAQSKTGATGLGGTSEGELELLANEVASLDQRLKPADLKAKITAIEKHYENLQRKSERGYEQAVERYGNHGWGEVTYE